MRSIEQLPINTPLVQQIESIHHFMREEAGDATGGSSKGGNNTGSSSSSATIAASASSKCSGCNAGATHYCTDCDADFCDEHCKQFHAFAAAKKHRLVIVAEKAAVRGNKPPQCEKHHSPMLLYCKQCSTLCCLVCHSQGAHRDHRTSVAEAHAGKVKQILIASSKRSECVEAVLDAHSKRIVQAYNNIITDEGARVQQVREACNAFRRRLGALEERSEQGS